MHGARYRQTPYNHSPESMADLLPGSFSQIAKIIHIFWWENTSPQKTFQPHPKKLYPQKYAVLPGLVMPDTTPWPLDAGIWCPPYPPVQPIPSPPHPSLRPEPPAPVSSAFPPLRPSLRMGLPAPVSGTSASCSNPCQPGLSQTFPTRSLPGASPER